MRLAYLLSLGVIVAVGRPCWGQFVRPPVVVRPSVPVIHPPVHVPHTPGANQGGNGVDPEMVWWVLGGGAGVGGLGLGALLVYRWRKRAAPRAIIRITAVPPGEAPEFVRRAWVGLELPLIVGQVHADKGTALGVLSHQAVNAPPGYAVEGKAAIAILASANAEIAAWWRQNAPDIAAPGYQLIFPAEVCERLDDLGS
jgi:hypothetical protein